MKEGYKALKGTLSAIQVLSLATLWVTKLSAPKRPLNYSNRQPPTTNSPSVGTTQPKPTSSVWSATSCAKAARQQNTTLRRPTWRRRSTLHVCCSWTRMHQIFVDFDPALHLIEQDVKRGQDAETHSWNLRERWRVHAGDQILRFGSRQLQFVAEQRKQLLHQHAEDCGHWGLCGCAWLRRIHQGIVCCS